MDASLPVGNASSTQRNRPRCTGLIHCAIDTSTGIDEFCSKPALKDTPVQVSRGPVWLSGRRAHTASPLPRKDQPAGSSTIISSGVKACRPVASRNPLQPTPSVSAAATGSQRTAPMHRRRPSHRSPHTAHCAHPASSVPCPHQGGQPWRHPYARWCTPHHVCAGPHLTSAVPFGPGRGSDGSSLPRVRSRRSIPKQLALTEKGIAPPN